MGERFTVVSKVGESNKKINEEKQRFTVVKKYEEPKSSAISNILPSISFEKITSVNTPKYTVEHDIIKDKLKRGEGLSAAERKVVSDFGVKEFIGGDTKLLFDINAQRSSEETKKLIEKKNSGKKLTSDEENILETAKLVNVAAMDINKNISKLTDNPNTNKQNMNLLKAGKLYQDTAYTPNSVKMGNTEIQLPDNASNFDKKIIQAGNKLDLYLVSGIEQYASGIGTTIDIIAGKPNKEIANRASGTYTIAGSVLSQHYTETGKDFDKAIQDIVTNIAQNAIPMAVGMGLGTVGVPSTAANVISQAGTFAPSIFGNAYKEGLDLGVTDTSKLLTYAFTTTAAETTLSIALSNMPGLKGTLSESAAINLTKNITNPIGIWAIKTAAGGGGEFLEESIQQILSPLMQKYILGADVETIIDDPLGQLSDAAYAGFIGFASSVFMGGGMNAISAKTESNLKQYGQHYLDVLSKNNIDIKNVATYISEITEKKSNVNKTAELVKNGDTSAYTVGSMINEIAQISETGIKTLYEAVGKEINNKPQAAQELIIGYETLLEDGYIFPEKVDALFERVKSEFETKESVSNDLVGEFVINVQTYSPRALIMGQAVKNIDSDIVAANEIKTGNNITANNEVANIVENEVDDDIDGEVHISEDIKDIAISNQEKKRHHTNQVEQNYIKDVAVALGVDMQFVHVVDFLKKNNIKLNTIIPDALVTKNGKIYMGFTTTKPIEFLLKHELSDLISFDETVFQDVMNSVVDSSLFTEWIKTKGYNNTTEFVNQIIKERVASGDPNFVGKGKNDLEYQAYIEITSDFIAEKCFGGTESIKGLVEAIKDKPSVKEKILQWLKDLIIKIKNHGILSLEMELRNIEKTFADAFNKAQSKKKNTPDDGSARFSFNPINKESKFNATSRGDIVLDSEESIISAIEDSLKNRSLKQNYIIGSIPDSVKNKIITDTKNNPFKNGEYVLKISGDDIRHIEKHFDNSKDMLKSIYRLYDVICNYDSVQEIKMKDGQIRLKFEKSYDDYSYLTITIASKKSRCLDLVSFYITKNNKKTEDKIQSPAEDSAAQGVSSSINSIHNKSATVNSNDMQKIEINSHKQKQFEVISKNNPANDDYHTWIRSVEDIKTFEETLQDNDWKGYSEFDPDYTLEMAQEAIKSGEITVYSSYPIEQGIFVTPSKMEAESYSGNDKVYEKTVKLTDVAWIDPTQGMYAETNENNVQYSVSNNTEFFENDIDLYTEEQYNNYGWIRANDVMSPAEYNQFNSYFADHKIHNHHYVQTKYGDSIIPVGKNLDVLVYANGDIDSPKISKVVKINLNDEYNVSEVRSKILEYERQGYSQPYQIIEAYYGEGIFDRLLKRDYADYRTVKQRFAERGKGKELYSNNSELQNGTGSNEKDNDIAPIKTSSNDGVFFDTKSNSDYRFSIPTQTADDLITRFENGEITREQFKEAISKKSENLKDIADLTPEDANTTPKLNRKQGKAKGDEISNTYESLLGSDIFDKKFKDEVRTDEFIMKYQSVTNKETLRQAAEELDAGGQSYVNKWWARDSKHASLIDTAVGFILMDRYQRTGDYESAVAVTEKIREIGTTAGQQVQIFSILGRLDPNSMAVYAQRELSKMFEVMCEKRTQKWIDNNSERFKLTEEEIEFIRRKTIQASMLPEGRDKAVRLAEIATMLQNKVPHEKGQSVRALQRISMLLNFRTNIRNVTGNAGMVPAFIMSDFFGSGIDRIISKKTNVRTTGNFKLSSVKGMKKGAFESYDDFKRKINTRNSEMDRFEVGKGKSFDEQHKGFLAWQRNDVSKMLNAMDRLTSFCLDFGDRIFYEMWFINSINNQLELNNTTEATTEMIKIATEEALQRTWQDTNDMTKFVSNIKSGLNKLNISGYGLGDVFVKFTKTPANLTKAIYDFSPVAGLQAAKDGKALYDSIQKGQCTPEIQKKFVNSLSKAITGTFFYVGAFALASAGMISGGADEDKDIANFEKYIEGIPPYSIKIFGKWYSYEWAQPAGSVLAIAADYMKSKRNYPDNAWYDDILLAIKSGGTVLYNQSFMQSLQNLFTADNFIDGIIEGVVDEPSVFIPQIVSQFANVTDDYRRVAFEYDKPFKTALNNMITKIPVVRKSLEKQVDVLGRDIKNSNSNIFNAFFNPANTYTNTSNEVSNEVYRVYKQTGQAKAIPKTAPNYVTVKGIKHNFSSFEKSDLQRICGNISSELLSDAIKTEEYKSLTDEQKADFVAKIYDFAYAQAKSSVEWDYETLAAMVGEDRNKNPILTKNMYDKLSDRGREELAKEYFLTKTEYRLEDNNNGLISHYLKSVTD